MNLKVCELCVRVCVVCKYMYVCVWCVFVVCVCVCVLYVCVCVCVGVVCLGGMLHHSCTSSCGRSCRSLSNAETCNRDDCAEGCGCTDTTYYDDARQRCVQQ